MAARHDVLTAGSNQVSKREINAISFRTSKFSTIKKRDLKRLEGKRYNTYS